MINIFKNSFRSAAIVGLGLLFIGCQPENVEVKDYLDGWEYRTTYKVLPSRSITFVKSSPEAVLGFAEIVPGKNDLLTVHIVKKPIYSSDRRMSDLVTYRDLLIELNPMDSVVTPLNLGHSRIFRQIVKMSPYAGAEAIESGEKIEIRRQASKRWQVKSDLEDFQFQAEFSFIDSSTFTTRHTQMFTDD